MAREYSDQYTRYDPPLERWYYKGRESLIKVFTQPEQISRLDEDKNFNIYNLNREMNLSEALDFEVDLAVAIFQGIKGSTGYGVEVQCITIKDESVLIYTRFTEPVPGQAVGEMVTSPYEIIKICREELGLDGMVNFTLFVGETAIDTEEADLSQ